VVVTGEDVRHIVTVLRMKTGDELLLCDGQGTEYLARISGLTRTEVRADVVSQTNRGIAFPRITLGQGLPKSDKMDFIVQKTTELGVASFVPLVTERTIVKIRDEARRIMRWQKIAREAAMQSNRADIPMIGPLQSLHDFLMTHDPGPMALSLLPWEEGTTHIKSVLRAVPDVKSIIVLIGPEGGFSKDEAASAKDKGFHLVSLGRNILRTETAALAALSMIVYEYC
jgi:16S rRNA (uracil1498-N3)-methyltransferase